MDLEGLLAHVDQAVPGVMPKHGPARDTTARKQSRTARRCSRSYCVGSIHGRASSRAGGSLRQPGGFEGRVPDPCSPGYEPPARRALQEIAVVRLSSSDSAASAPPVFVQQDDDVVARVNELLCLQAALFPRLQIPAFQVLGDLGKTVGNQPPSSPPTVPWNSTLGSTSRAVVFLIPLPGTLRRPLALSQCSPATSPAQYRPSGTHRCPLRHGLITGPDWHRRGCTA